MDIKILKNHNKLNIAYPSFLTNVSNKTLNEQAYNEITKWAGYSKTPLLELDKLAKKLAVAKIYYKDESQRFGLKSFKALGGAYGVLYLLKTIITNKTKNKVSFQDIRDNKYQDITKNITVVTATDGNHGRSVAWGAKSFGCNCEIYIHKDVSKARKEEMEALGAKVIRVNGNYDYSVTEAKKQEKQSDTHIVSDTSYNGYTKIPKQIMAGYSVMLAEIFNTIKDDISHIFVQGGCGGLAACVCSYYWQKLGGDMAKFIVVEPDVANCLYQSCNNNTITDINIVKETIQAGLSCGNPSFLAWDILKNGVDYFMTITDNDIASTMQAMANKTYSSKSIIAGESAVAGIVGLIATSKDSKIKNELKLNINSKILLLGTEGATDKQIYDKLVKSD